MNQNFCKIRLLIIKCFLNYISEIDNSETMQVVINNCGNSVESEESLGELSNEDKDQNKIAGTRKAAKSQEVTQKLNDEFIFSFILMSEINILGQYKKRKPTKKSIKCGKCGKTLFDERNLVRHEQAVHQGTHIFS